VLNSKQDGSEMVGSEGVAKITDLHHLQEEEQILPREGSIEI
jgi:hypothetical protein